jgi:hypothetical protein
VSPHELAGIFFGRGRKGGIVALCAYFDGAGDEGQDAVITVAGYYAESTLCETIEREWEEATQNRVFHLKDFGQPHCKLESFKWTGDQRRAFLKKLAGIVNRPGVGIISSTVEVEHFYKKLATTAHPNEIGPAFSGCAYAAVAITEFQFMKELKQGEEVRYVFEKGDREHEMSNLFADLAKKDSKMFGLRGHAFEPKKTTLLQPADLIAGIVQRCALRAYEPLKSLDNGMAYTFLNTFERHYDEVTCAVVTGHDDKTCWIVNAKSFEYLDLISKAFLEEHPEQLSKRKKRYTYKPKGNKSKRTQNSTISTRRWIRFSAPIPRP